MARGGLTTHPSAPPASPSSPRSLAEARATTASIDAAHARAEAECARAEALLANTLLDPVDGAAPRGGVADGDGVAYKALEGAEAALSALREVRKRAEDRPRTVPRPPTRVLWEGCENGFVTRFVRFSTPFHTGTASRV